VLGVLCAFVVPFFLSPQIARIHTDWALRSLRLRGANNYTTDYSDKHRLVSVYFSMQAKRIKQVL